MANERLQIVLDAVWRGANAVRKAEQDIRGVDKTSEKTGSRMKSLAIGVGAVTAAFGATALAAREVYQTLQEGAALERSRQQFDNLSESIGATADALLVDMRRATSGMMSDAALIESAGQIISLGLADTQEGVTRLATVIGTLGLDMQQVILTFANNSTMRLDALGLSVENVTQKAAELEAQGFVGDAFDEAVLIALEEKMALLGDASETTAGKLAMLQARWENANNAFKESFAASLAEEMGLLADNTDAASESMQRFFADIGSGLGGGIANIINDMAFGAELERSLTTGQINQEQYNRIFGTYLKGLGRAIRSDSTISDAVNEAREELLNVPFFAQMDRSQTVAGQFQQQSDARAAYEATISSVERYGQELDNLSRVGRTVANVQSDISMELRNTQREADRLAETEMFLDFANNQPTAEQAINDTNSALLQQIENMGLGAEATAMAKLALSEFTLEQANAAIKASLIAEKAGEFAEAVKNGEMTVLEAASALRQFADDLDEPISKLDIFRQLLDDIPDVKTINFNVEGGPVSVSGAGGTSRVGGYSIPVDARAMGGPVYGGVPYLVGERGPELFVPNTNGSIAPNGSFGGVTINAYNRESAAVAMAWVSNARRSRLDSRMGVAA